MLRRLWGKFFSGGPKFLWLIVLWLVLSAIWWASWLLVELKVPKGDRGQFGDMFGAVNALFSGLAFGTLIFTVWMQKEELESQRNALMETRKDADQQKKYVRTQQFEATFLSLLSAHSEIVAAMDILASQGAKDFTKGRDCFQIWYRRLKERYNKNDPASHDIVDIHKTYEMFFDLHQADLAHYFRHLYQIVRFIKESGVGNKQQYVDLVRAQISSYEHLLLFYSCLSNCGPRGFKSLVEEFSFFEDMPRKLLLHPRHEQLYMGSAYGKSFVSDESIASRSVVSPRIDIEHLI